MARKEYTTAGEFIGKEKEFNWESFWLVVQGEHKEKILRFTSIGLSGEKETTMVDVNGTEFKFMEPMMLRPYHFYPENTDSTDWKDQRKHRREVITIALKDIDNCTRVVPMHEEEPVDVHNPFEALSKMGYNMVYLVNFIEYKLANEPLQLEVGETYESNDGKAIEITKEEHKYDIGGHNTVAGMSEHGHLNYYNRPNNHGNDNGRVCTTAHDYSFEGNVKIENGQFVKWKFPQRRVMEIKVKDDVMYGEGVIAYVIALNKEEAKSVFLEYTNLMWVDEEITCLDLGEADNSRPKETYITYFRGVDGVEDIGEDVKEEES